MAGYSQAPARNAYQSTANYGRVAAADPHGLIVVLMDGVVERIARARGCISNKAFADKAQLIHSAVTLIDQLRNSLDMRSGGSIAENLDNLYEYMCRRLLQGSVENDITKLDEVLGLIHQIRGAWLEIPKLQGTAR